MEECSDLFGPTCGRSTYISDLETVPKIGQTLLFVGTEKLDLAW